MAALVHIMAENIHVRYRNYKWFCLGGREPSGEISSGEYIQPSRGSTYHDAWCQVLGHKVRYPVVDISKHPEDLPTTMLGVK
jgi:hypothetical protein